MRNMGNMKIYCDTSEHTVLVQLTERGMYKANVANGVQFEGCRRVRTETFVAAFTVIEPVFLSFKYSGKLFMYRTILGVILETAS